MLKLSLVGCSWFLISLLPHQPRPSGLPWDPLSQGPSLAAKEARCPCRRKRRLQRMWLPCTVEAMDPSISHHMGQNPSMPVSTKPWKKSSSQKKVPKFLRHSHITIYHLTSSISLTHLLLYLLSLKGSSWSWPLKSKNSTKLHINNKWLSDQMKMFLIKPCAAASKLRSSLYKKSTSLLA